MSFTESTVADAVLAEAFEAITTDVVEPNYDALSRTADFVVIVVGEQVAAIANRSGIPAIGLSDITAWTATSGQVDEASNIHPELLANVACNARGVIVLAPSDVSADPLARTSLTSLAKALDREAGIPAVYAVIPAPRKQQGKATPGHNLDGWINATSESVVTCHLGMVWSKELRSREVRKSGGWIPLGYMGDRNVVFSVSREQIFELSPSKLMDPGEQIVIAGNEFLEEVFGYVNKSGQMIVPPRAVAGAIASQCLAVGPYLPKGSRFSGAHVERGNVLVINGADTIFRTDGAPQARFGGTFSYPRGKRSVGITADTPQATTVEMQFALAAVESFPWAEDAHALLAFGWLCNAYYTAAVDWRIHAMVTGTQGSGKSTFASLTTRLIGDLAVACDADLSAAGIRNNLDGDACVIVVDQSDSTPGRADEVRSVFRSASSSTNVLRSDQRQGAINKRVCFSGIFVGVSKPVLNAEDQTRYIQLGMRRAPEGARRTTHPLIKDKDLSLDLGKNMFARMVFAWPRYLKAVDVFRGLLGNNARAPDSLTPILAAAWVALNDHEVSVTEAEELMTKMNIKAEEERIAQTSDEADAFDHLLGKVIKVQADGRNTEATVAEAIAMALGEVRTGGRPGEWSRSLGLYGMRACLNRDRLETLYLNTLDFQFRQIFAGTKWVTSDMADLFKRLPTASCKAAANTISIGGRSVRPLEIALPSDLESMIISRIASEG